MTGLISGHRLPFTDATPPVTETGLRGLIAGSGTGKRNPTSGTTV